MDGFIIVYYRMIKCLKELLLQEQVVVDFLFASEMDLNGLYICSYMVCPVDTEQLDYTEHKLDFGVIPCNFGPFNYIFPLPIFLFPYKLDYDCML